jgi:hypothetical protein
MPWPFLIQVSYLRSCLGPSDNVVMKDSKCLVCKFRDSDIPKVRDDLIYDAKGNSILLPLCYSHSVDLFKVGQISFIMKYKKVFSGTFGIEKESDLVNFFKPYRDRTW